MKFKELFSLPSFYSFIKRDRRMKTAFCFLFTVFFQFSALATYSQTTNLSLSFNNVPIEDIIDQIERETELKFLILDKELETDKKVNLQADEKPVVNILEDLFTDTNIRYRIMDKQVVLSKKEEAPAISQQNKRRIQGTVLDEDGEPIIGANVVEKGTTNGNITNINGEFTLEVSPNATLQVSYIGYTTKEVPVGNQTSLTISLGEDAQALDEVVVVAFSTMKKEAFTGSAGVLSAENILRSQQTDASQALAGRVAGVQINNASGQFGAAPSINIRGVGSITSDNSPLIVLDGMPYDGDLNNINPADIETMTVLKDAASNALYGARGANGVIMITTRRGKSGGASISFDAKWGINKAALKTHDYIKDPGQYYETYYKALYNKNIADGMSASEAHSQANYAVSSETAGLGPGYMVYTVPNGQDFIGTDGRINSAATLGRMINFEGTDYWLQPDSWEDEALKNGFRQEYVMNVSGASEKINYYASLGYLTNEGITVNSKMERLTGRLKGDYQAKKWLKIGANVSYSNYNYDRIGEGTIGSTGNIWSFINGMAPIYPVYMRDGNKDIMLDDRGQQMYDFGNSAGLQRASYSGANPLFNNKYDVNNMEGNAFTGNVFADINFTEKLKLTVNGSTAVDEYRQTWVTSPYAERYGTTQSNGSVTKAHNRRYSYNTQQLLSYTTDFLDNHNLNVLLGHEYYYYKYSYLRARKTNMAFEDNHELNGALNSSAEERSYIAEYNNEGYFARVMYDYQNKYYLSGSFRRDASSRFHPDNRWGNFWSVGAAWLIDKEDWFNITWVDSFKFKASVGVQGNDKIGIQGDNKNGTEYENANLAYDNGYYLYADQYNIVNNLGEASFTFKQKGSKNITWETNINFNTGFEFNLFNGKLGGSIDYFYRKTTDMLFSVTVPPSIGYTSYYDNVGDMRNSGIEIDLNTVLIRTRDLRWDFNLNISHVSNKILMLPDDKKTFAVDGHGGYTYDDASFVSKYKFFIGEGLPLYTWYLPEYAGVNEEGLSTWYKDVKDSNGNIVDRETTTTYTEADNYLHGTSIPKVYGGFGTSIYFRGFDLSANFNYQIGGKAYDYGYQTSMSAPSAAYGGHFHKDVSKAWSADNSNSDIPRFQYGDTNQTSRSDRFLTNASFLNIQNINVGYTIPKDLIRKWDLDNLRIYISCENVAYVSARRGFDPRQSIMGYTNPQTYTPIRTISFGLNLNF